MDARSGFSIPLTECIHRIIQKQVLAGMSPVEVEVCPRVAHGCVCVRDMARTVMIRHAMCYSITKTNDVVIIMQVKLFDGRGHQGQEEAMILAYKWQSIQPGGVDCPLRNGRVKKNRFVIDQRKNI